MKIIKYIPKTTSARTEYREVQEDDLKWVQEQLIRYLTRMGEMDQQHDEDSKWVLNQWWHKRTDKLHRGAQGQNTPCSMVAGMINNMMFKDQPQRDLTDKQMADLEYISAVISQLSGCEAIRFQIGFQ
jgi:hypothetical protein